MKKLILYPLSFFLCTLTFAQDFTETTNSLFTGIGEFPLDTSVVQWTPPSSRDYIDMAFDGTNYMIVWSDWRNYESYRADVYIARMTPDGEMLDIGGIAVCRQIYGQEEPAIAFDGTNFMVVWEDFRRSPLDGDIYGARITPEGIVLDPDGFPIAASEDIKQESPDIGYDGNNYMVVWTDNSPGSWDNITGTRVSTSGEVLDDGGFVVSNLPNFKTHPEIAFDGTNYLAVWVESINNSKDIYGARITPDGLSLDINGFSICSQEDTQYAPVICFGNTNYLVAWSDGRAQNTSEIYGARVTPSGSVLDQDGFLIATSEEMDSRPSITYDGSNFFIGWERGMLGDVINDIPDTREIYGTWVDQEGNVLDPLGKLLVNSPEGSYSTLPALVFNGTEYALIWKKQTQLSDIFFSPISIDGTVDDPSGIKVAVSANTQKWPAVAWDGNNYLAVWSDFRGEDGYIIYGTRIGPDGTILDPYGFEIAKTEGWDAYQPDVSFNGTNYLVVWEAGYGIFCNRVSPAGNVLEQQPIVILDGNTLGVDRPKVTSDGNNWLVMYHKGTLEVDIYGSRISPDGAVLDGEGFPICTAPEEQRDPIGAFDGQNYLVTWEDERMGFPAIGIYAARITPAAEVLDPDGFVVSQEYYMKQDPSIAFNGTNYLIAWSDSHDIGFDISARRIGIDGTLIDQTDKSISTANGDQIPVKIDFDGTNYLAVWQDDRNGIGSDIYGAFINADGNVVKNVPVSKHPYSQMDPAVAAGNGKILVVYSRHTDNINSSPVDVERIWGVFSDDLTDIEEYGLEQKTNIELFQNFPNPFSGSTTIRYQIKVNSDVELIIFDMYGNTVTTLINHHQREGNYEVRFNGRKLASGIYYLSLSAGMQTETKKLILMRR